MFVQVEVVRFYKIMSNQNLKDEEQAAPMSNSIGIVQLNKMAKVEH